MGGARPREARRGQGWGARQAPGPVTTPFSLSLQATGRPGAGELL